jgi:PAS domain S-box-containing protein
MFNYNRYDRVIGYEELKLNKYDLIVSKTDLGGKITYANPTFLQITQYSTSELVGQNHNIVRHPDMPRSVYKYMWDRLVKEEHVHCFVKNLTKEGAHYWTFAYIMPDFDERGVVMGYHSERRAPNPKAISEIINLYCKVKEIEIAKGIDAGIEYLHERSLSKADNCEQYIFKLQNQE